jgi:FkbM family methyltransferase
LHIGAQLALRSWPFPRGSGRLADVFFSNLPFGSEPSSIITSDGFPMLIQPSELIGRHLYLTGEFDRSTFEVLHNFSQPGDRLLDVGANIGYVSACFLWNVPKSSVIAVDPQPGVIELLRNNLGHFEPNRYQIFSVAVSDKSGIGTMEICTNNRGASRLTNSIGECSVQIDIWSFSQLLAEAKIEKINLIKLDVEGYEERVISAMAPMLDRIQPRAIIYEDHGNKSAPDSVIGRTLREAGYCIFGIRKGLLRLELMPIRAASDCVFNDYVAVRSSMTAPSRALRKYPALRNLSL